MQYVMKVRLVILIIVITPFQALADNDVMIEQILHYPDRYNGKIINISGFISIEFENMTIASKHKYKYGDCVWIEFDNGPYKTDEDMARYDKHKEILKAKYNKKKSSIKGLFTSGRSGHLGSCSGKLNVINYEVQ
jgi:hypothetical protein